MFRYAYSLHSGSNKSYSESMMAIVHGPSFRPAGEAFLAY